jgi:hypothetical protein
MTQTIIDDSELIGVITKTVAVNGQISIGKEYAGQRVRAYIVQSEWSASNPQGSQ